MKEHRIRCYGHILNLAAQAFLQVEFRDIDYTVEDSNVGNSAIGKLHAFVVRMQKSPQRYHQFLVLSRGKSLPRDNSTRWNSFEKMITRALEPEIRVAIDRFSAEQNTPEQERITLADWLELEKVRTY